jgi:carboxyl-terminal processing protease
VVATAVGALATPKRNDRFDKLDVFAQALSFIENNYVDPIDENALIYGAVDGMVDGLDNFSNFMPPNEYRRIREDTEGTYAGVGIAVSTGGDGVPVIIEVMAGLPAESVGLRVDDRIVTVAGVKTAGSEGAWRGSLRGKVGTSVTIEVERAGWDEARAFELPRRRIRGKSAETDTLDEDVAYIRVHQFQQDTSGQVRAALRSAKRQAGGAIPGLILDLRGNPGGLFDEAVDTADLFLESGTIVTVRARRGRMEQPQAESKGTWSGFPIAVVVDGRSASSAEIVAGALQDHGRAVVVGEPSYGKGSVQSLLDLDDGSGLKLTTARYLTPNGQSIEGSGIQPDVAATDPAEQVEKAYQTLRSLELSNSVSAGK